MKSYGEILGEMEDEFYELTGIKPDDATDISIRFKVLAGQLFALYTKCDAVMRQVFPQTADGSYLDLHAQERGVTRKAPTYAEGTLTFYRENESETELEIPQGTICSTGGSSAKRFVTTESATLPSGGISVTVNARAEGSGKAYNAGRGAVRVMVTPPQGIVSVSNEEAFTGGNDAEDDESLRRRLLDTYSCISNGANAAFYRETALRHSEIGDANAIPRARGRGTVDVVVISSSNTPASAEVLDEVTETLENAREVGVDVRVYNATLAALPVRIYIKPKEGYDSARIIEAATDAVKNFVDCIGIGKTLYVKDLHALLAKTEGVENYYIMAPRSDYEVPQSTKLNSLLVNVSEMI